MEKSFILKNINKNCFFTSHTHSVYQLKCKSDNKFYAIRYYILAHVKYSQ